MSVSRAVNMSFVATGILLWLISVDLYAFVLGLIGPTANQGLIGVGFTVSDLLGIATGIGGAFALKRHEQVNTLAHEIANELSKVTWPTWPETRFLTVVVIIVTLICALGFVFFDMLWSNLIGLIYS
jgi:preprotein translocase subunit SecE